MAGKADGPSFYYVYDIPYMKRREICTMLDVDRGWEPLAAEFGFTNDDIGTLSLASHTGQSPSNSLMTSLGNLNIPIAKFHGVLIKIKRLRAASAIEHLVRPQSIKIPHGEPAQRIVQPDSSCSPDAVDGSRSQNIAAKEFSLPPKPGKSSKSQANNQFNNLYENQSTNNFSAVNLQQYRQSLAPQHPTAQSQPDTSVSSLHGFPKSGPLEDGASLKHQHYSFRFNEDSSHVHSLKARPDAEQSHSSPVKEDKSMSFHKTVNSPLGAEGGHPSFVRSEISGGQKPGYHLPASADYQKHLDFVNFNIPVDPRSLHVSDKQFEIKNTPEGPVYDPGLSLPTSGDPGPVAQEPVESPDYSSVTANNFFQNPSRQVGSCNLKSEMKSVSTQLQNLFTTSSSNNQSLTTGQVRQGEALVHTPSFPYSEILQATHNFSPNNIIGTGGFGTVYRGNMKQTIFAIKKLRQNFDYSKEKSRQQHHIAEVEALQLYRHENIVQLCGYSMDGPELCLIYQFMVNGSLEDRLACKCDSKPLTWCQRVNIMLGAARGVQYLHSFEKPLIHGDIKSSNILLDKHLEAKIADFGLAKQATAGESGKYTHVTLMQSGQQIQGSRPYLPDDFFRTYKLHTKTDTYSFGVVIMEVCTGEKAYDEKREGEKLLHEYIHGIVSMKDEQKILALCDQKCSDWPNHIFLEMLHLGCICTNKLKKNRYEMGKVCQELEQLDVKGQIFLSQAAKRTPVIGSVIDGHPLSMAALSAVPSSMRSFYLSHQSQGVGASLHAGVPCTPVTPGHDVYPSHAEQVIPATQQPSPAPEITVTPATGDLTEDNTKKNGDVEKSQPQIPSYEDPKYLDYDKSKLGETEGNSGKTEDLYPSDPVKLAKLKEGERGQADTGHITPLQLQQQYDLASMEVQKSSPKELKESKEQIESPCKTCEIQKEKLTAAVGVEDEDLYSSMKAGGNIQSEERLQSERQAISKAFQEKKPFSWMEEYYEDKDG